jgi:hypothetical protein
MDLADITGGASKDKEKLIQHIQFFQLEKVLFLNNQF